VVEEYHDRIGRPLRRPMLVIVSGAPGSGKTTMGGRLATELRLPHLNRDLVRDGLWMTDGDDVALTTDRAWRVWLSAVTLYVKNGVSLVLDQTFYRGLSDVTLRRELVPITWAVNVHLVASHATERWRTGLTGKDGGAPTSSSDCKVEGIQPQVRDPLDFGCPQIVVDTTEPEVPITPLARRIWSLVQQQNSASPSSDSAEPPPS
jgi:predicted kinase